MPASPSIELTTSDKACLLDLVWQVIDAGLTQGGLTLPEAPESEALLTPAACFVTLHQGGELRGCIGRVDACEPLWLCACENAYGAAFKDRRFARLRSEERESLTLDISILSPLTPMENQGEAALCSSLRPNIDGLLMDDGHRRALFLPSVWQSLPDPKDFVSALKQKGGWPQDYWRDTITLQRFTTQVVKD
ncbi:AmmeMemoRadiSam system protein A [Shewanella rhizosphaerae]|uniref:AmmeMemoRadiSam system protein A n=1 Tax=Shewanella rhizosphaerae TaxID=2864207 RepID=UPI001C658C7B|nr:AmmeMemoRadiSam system protein A [Shewanella rhizosphaerae]QYK13837.1 AmmeMemoRadiSam system protein A [Shewanella rhizosphaerae]